MFIVCNEEISFWFGSILFQNKDGKTFNCRCHLLYKNFSKHLYKKNFIGQTV